MVVEPPSQVSLQRLGQHAREGKARFGKAARELADARTGDQRNPPGLEGRGDGYAQGKPQVRHTVQYASGVRGVLAPGSNIHRRVSLNEVPSEVAML